MGCIGFYFFGWASGENTPQRNTGTLNALNLSCPHTLDRHSKFRKVMSFALSTAVFHVLATWQRVTQEQ
jgi:hypothetical protein